MYVEYLPLSWGEEKVSNYFKEFGEIENVVLARNLHSSKRKDFAFINFRTREDALRCIESCNHEMLSDEGSKVCYFCMKTIIWLAIYSDDLFVNDICIISF